MLTAHLYQKLSELIPKGESFAIAFSGGGDSTALVHALKDHPQAKHIYIVDHNLRSGSESEARGAHDFALTCGYKSKVLKWKHNFPTSALQEKARKARYGLMGDECRKDGIKYLLTAHSEDDQAETLLMRYDRRTDWRGAAGMTEITYGPVWPELATVNVVRPLLEISREELRDYNRKHKLRWAEDPSNQNREYARIRARDYLKTRPNLRREFLETAREMYTCLREEKAFLREQFEQIGHIDANGIISLTDIPVPELMFHSLRCAGGQGGLIDRAKIRKLLSQMRGAAFKSATFGGALIAKHKTDFVICRDPVSVKGRQDSHHDRQNMRASLGFRLSDIPQIWDGRFSVTEPKGQAYMGTAHDNYALLREEQRESLKKIPSMARPTLPVSKHETSIRAIGHQDLGSQAIISLVKTRFEAALGGKVS